MAVVNTNVNALFAQNALKVNNRDLSKSIQQLSTGSRINSAGDDAAGLAIASTMTAQIRGLNQAVRNANDGISMLQTAEGSMSAQSNILQRMRELAIQASTGTYSSAQRGYLQTEFSALTTQISNIASQTTWNGINILDGTGGTSGSFDIQVGTSSGQTITVTIANVTTSSSGLSVSGDISTASGAVTALSTIDTALDTLNDARATIGAGINQLTYAADNMTSMIQNYAASKSQIADTDYATATSNMARAQIIQQAATAMLAQANQSPQYVLALLK
jgi:flagellin